jgi:hypothetical protein
VIDYFRFIDHKAPLNEAVNYLGHSFHSTDNIQTRLTCLLCLLVAQQTAHEGLRNGVRKQIVAFVLTECIEELKRLIDQTDRHAIAVEKRNPFVRILIASFTPDVRASGALVLRIDIQELYDSLFASLLPKWRLDGFPLSLEAEFEPVPFGDLAAFDKNLTLSNQGAIVTSFFRRFPNPTQLIPVNSVGRRSFDATARGRTVRPRLRLPPRGTDL